MKRTVIFFLSILIMIGTISATHNLPPNTISTSLDTQDLPYEFQQIYTYQQDLEEANLLTSAENCIDNGDTFRVSCYNITTQTDVTTQIDFNECLYSVKVC